MGDVEDLSDEYGEVYVIVDEDESCSGPTSGHCDDQSNNAEEP